MLGTLAKGSSVVLKAIDPVGDILDKLLAVGVVALAQCLDVLQLLYGDCDPLLEHNVGLDQKDT